MQCKNSTRNTCKHICLNTSRMMSQKCNANKITMILIFCFQQSLIYTHLHYLFKGLFSRTTRVNRYQKGKTTLDLNQARDDGISWVIYKQSALHSRQTTTPTPHHSIFTDRMLFLTPNQHCQSTEGLLINTYAEINSQVSNYLRIYSALSMSHWTFCYVPSIRVDCFLVAVLSPCCNVWLLLRWFLYHTKTTLSSATYVGRQRGTTCIRLTHAIAAAHSNWYILSQHAPTAANLLLQVCCCGPMLGQPNRRTHTVPFHRLHYA